MARAGVTKLSVIGAGGVGVAVAFAALVRGSADEVALFDIDDRKVEAEVLDFAHGRQFLGSTRVYGGSDISVVAGSDMVVVTAGAKQKPGESRLDLAARNARIMRSLLPAILEQAPDAIIMLVTNPCDVLTVLAVKETGLPTSRCFSSGTVLDSSRLRWRLAEESGVNARSVHALMLGEHGDTEFPLWSRAKIGPVPVREWERDGKLMFDDASLDAIAHEVVNAAYKVIEGKGATSSAIGLSTAHIVESVLRDERSVLPVSSVLTGQQGISGVALSLPSVIGRDGVEEVIEVGMEPDEYDQLQASAQALRAALGTL